MDNESVSRMAVHLKDEEVKIVWREEERTKIGRGKLVDYDGTFVYVKGAVIVNKQDVIVVKQS